MAAMTEDEMMAAAIAASIADNTELTTTEQLDTAFEALANNGGGVIRQVNLLNQFSDAWQMLIEVHHAPESICGYLSLAYAVILARAFAQPGDGDGDGGGGGGGGGDAAASRLELAELEPALRDVDSVMVEVDRAMGFIEDSRRRYIEAHPNDFATESARRLYMRAWVANYEISDYLRAEPEQVRREVCFLRFNQYPEYQSARHEERQRMAEEARFGGSKTGDKSDVACYNEGDSMFIVEAFGPAARTLETPAEFLSRSAGAGPTEVGGVGGDFKMARPRIVVLDLNGHFSCSLAVPTGHGGGGGGDGGGEPTLHVLNTTSTSYVSGMAGSSAMCQKAHEVFALGWVGDGDGTKGPTAGEEEAGGA